MIQRGSRFGFLLKSQEALGIKRNQFGNDFDCYVAVQAYIARTVHLAHAARAKRREYLVLTDFCAWDQRHRGNYRPRYLRHHGSWGLVASFKRQASVRRRKLPLDARSFQVRCFRAARWYGSGRILNRSSQDRAFDGKALDPYLSAFVDRQQRIHCRGIEPLARETPDDLQGLV